MRRGLRFHAALAASLVLLAGFTPPSSRANEGEGHQDHKARIAVGEITSSTGKCTSGMTSAVGDLLSTALANTQRFVVLDDQGDLGSTGIVLNATVTRFEPEAGSGGGLRARAMRRVGVQETSAEIEMEFRLVGSDRGRILSSKSVEAKSANWGVNVSGGNWVSDLVLGGALGEYSGEPMEDAIRSALAQAVELIIDEVPEDYFRYTGDERLGGDPEAGAAAGDPGAVGAGAEAPSEVAEDMTLFTRYDFVPGNKVIFYDDMSDEEEGEFPYRWNLDRGVYEVVRLGGEFWIMATDNGSIRPRTPDAPLPPKYTVEMEFYNNGPDHTGNYFYIHFVDDRGENLGEFGISSSSSTWLSIDGDMLASKTLAKSLTEGIHTMRIMATARTMKCFVDEERVANVPRIEGFNPVGFRISHRPYRDPENPTLFRGFRFAEGGKTMREQLDEEGKIVTHGIFFDSGSHTIKGESYRTLSDIGQLLQDDPSLRLSIEGHTDSDGSDESNETLSQNRASSVREYLLSTYGMAPDRLEAKGWGEAEPIDTNDTPEGKANNRRVELVKLS